ncbi:DUF2892 domain-containing protein [Leptospira kmetyi]|uniref:DUF2892 domain-containing protein n=1 Tax=Leptospira kmetyi TaxID=408139 RepID=A0AAD0URB0_9LEPT|nr:DUF2892 domain-containing protein [Leptospira kmetyi]AYV57725.1 DUF2892 domain-containing protein [Leptospira kmetyi]TGL69446.1 DUF2892 domain-containing protein [Leptospira kmetyi]
MNRWYLERMLFLIAGFVSLLGLTLGFYFSPWFLILNVLVGINQIVFALTGFCPMALILGKLGIPSAAEVFGGKK